MYREVVYREVLLYRYFIVFSFQSLRHTLPFEMQKTIKFHPLHYEIHKPLHCPTVQATAILIEIICAWALKKTVKTK